MRLFTFLKNETEESWTSVLALTMVSGIANGALLALINAGASAAASDALSFRLMVMFIIAIAVFILAKNISLNRSMLLVEGMIKRLRVRVCDKIRRSELPLVERLGRGQLYTTISQDANLISQSAFMITNASQSGIMVIFALIYVAWLSPLAFFIIVISIGCALLFYYYHRQSLHTDLEKLAVKDAQFLDALDHIIDGFKEAKLNRKKNDSLFNRFRAIANSTEDLKVSMGVQFVTDILFSQVFFYLLLGVIVFLLPRVVPTFSVVVLKMTAAVLFIIAPLEMIVNAMPVFSRSDVALKNLYALEERLDQHLEDFAEDEESPSKIDFRQRISIESAVFTYEDIKDVPLFTVGPVDLQINRGEILFIVGSNGSGKSTLLKILTGLYPLTSGVMRLDGQALTRRTIPAYRELFSAIFSDFHLFDRFYGLEDVDEAEVKAWIRTMELEDKTQFKNGRFTNTSLSTGQKKRLALIISLLEDREIYVFDEWAADQDVTFREYYYHTILGELKKRGKTVIAATHDDRYWKVADRIVTIDQGRVVGEPIPGTQWETAIARVLSYSQQKEKASDL